LFLLYAHPSATDIYARSLHDALPISWDFGPLPRTFERRTAGHIVRGYPALVDEGTTVGVRIFDNAAAQQQAMVAGTRRLLMLTVDRKSTRLNSSHVKISYAVFCLKKK